MGINGRHHMTQFRKNWAIIAFLITVIFGAGFAWSFTQKEYVERREFDTYKQVETRTTEQRFKDLNKLLDEKFTSVNNRIKDLGEHLEDIKDLIIRGQ